MLIPSSATIVAIITPSDKRLSMKQYKGIIFNSTTVAHWVVFERNADRGEEHGPERFLLLFVCGEGLATF